MTNLTPRQKVDAWLDKIGATDPEDRREVLTQCAENKEIRQYYLDRWESDCNAIS